jgi:hypothetical protein
VYLEINSEFVRYNWQIFKNMLLSKYTGRKCSSGYRYSPKSIYSLKIKEMSSQVFCLDCKFRTGPAILSHMAGPFY